MTTKLATAHRSRVSIRGHPVKTFLTSSLINTQGLVVVFHTVRAHVGVPKIVNAGDSAPLRWGVTDPLETRSYPMC